MKRWVAQAEFAAQILVTTPFRTISVAVTGVKQRELHEAVCQMQVGTNRRLAMWRGWSSERGFSGKDSTRNLQWLGMLMYAHQWRHQRRQGNWDLPILLNIPKEGLI